jgi:hypothetical protein
LPVTAPEKTRKSVSLPTCGSVRVLKTSAEKGSFGPAARVTVSLVRGSVPSTGGRSPGDGKESITMSSRERTPIAFVADPRITGTSLPSPIAARSALMTSASSRAPSSR